MCNSVTMLDGTEVWSMNEAIALGLLPESWRRSDGMDDCLCGVELEDLNGELVWPPRFRPGGIWMGWEEVDAEGRSWWRDAWMEKPGSREERFTELIPNPDYPYRKPAAGLREDTDQ